MSPVGVSVLTPSRRPIDTPLTIARRCPMPRCSKRCGWLSVGLWTPQHRRDQAQPNLSTTSTFDVAAHHFPEGLRIGARLGPAVSRTPNEPLSLGAHSPTHTTCVCAQVVVLVVFAAAGRRRGGAGWQRDAVTLQDARAHTQHTHSAHLRFSAVRTVPSCRLYGPGVPSGARERASDASYSSFVIRHRGLVVHAYTL